MAIALIGTLVSCNNETDLKLNASIDGLENGNFIVAKIENNRPTNIDTVEVKEGKFTYTEKMEGPDFRLFILEDNKQKGVFMYVGNENISLKGSIDSLDKADITGSENNDLYAGLLESFTKVQKEANSLKQEAQMAQMQKDSIKLESLKDAFEQNEKKVENLVYDFAKTNNDSPMRKSILFTKVFLKK